jgi:hypothetical protein
MLTYHTKIHDPFVDFRGLTVRLVQIFSRSECDGVSKHYGWVVAEMSCPADEYFILFDVTQEKNKCSE